MALGILVLADASDSRRPSIDARDSSVPGDDNEIDDSDCQMPVGDRSGWDSADVPSVMKSPAAATIPCWVPLIIRGPSAVVALSGGNSPNGVGTFAGPVE